ncbi:SMP-30/gluconolactonase/LRE family protein [Aliirhizobium smilacinae]|uniref:SMP-30/gluconolactonase/LRE family protein n=1 Tax=Aliirhizobium smilacinae TaxID=1395944 RepID=A0A5C4X9X3_9HYPH|nr:SMP-30/gluconolactonase/LRE family protein [Rhizobium smilacinae]TNM60283.1 SMP-30/gluconolactonase/LRE family protein [Rhizobium smilacinae]
MMDVRILDPRLPACQLGEGAYWDAPTASLYWVDIIGRSVHRYSPDKRAHQTWAVSKEVSFAYPNDRRLVLCMADGVYHLDPKSGEEMPIALLDLPKDHRLNDGKLDPQARLWVGTINTADDPSPTAALYVLRGDHLEEFEGGYANANGKAWSLDGGVMYHADTARNTIWQYDYDTETGVALNKRVFVKTGEDSPDGLSLDNDGNVIAAMFGSSSLNVFSPRGELLRRIALPVPNPTSCVLAGNALFITTAFDGLDDEQRQKFPLSGHIFVIDGYHK